MNRVSTRYALPLFAAVLIAFPTVNAQQSRGRKYKPPPPTCNVAITVVRADNGKPVEDAAVVFHPISKEGKDEGNMELKTNQDGKANLNVIPIGDTLRVQIIANGFQTFGNDYPLPGDSKNIVVKLHRPVRQYSIYESHPSQSAQNESESGQSGSGQSGSSQSDKKSSGDKQQNQQSQKPQ